MGLFTAGLYRSFLLGFGVTTVLMVANVFPNLGGL